MWLFGMVVFGVRSEAEHGLHLSSCAHDLVEVNLIDRGVFIDVVLELCFGFRCHSIASTYQI